MKTRTLALMFGMLFTAGTLAMGGVADAKTSTGAVGVNNADVYTLSCTSSLTHCMQVQVCDLIASSSDTWQQVLIGTSPPALLGDAVDFAVETTGGGGCNEVQTLCRAASTAGPMKGLIVVAHPDGDGLDNYYMNASCLDKNFNAITDTKTKLKKTTDNE